MRRVTGGHPRWYHSRGASLSLFIAVPDVVDKGKTPIFMDTHTSQLILKSAPSFVGGEAACPKFRAGPLRANIKICRCSEVSGQCRLLAQVFKSGRML